MTTDNYEDRLFSARQVLSRTLEEAYKDEYLLSNQVLGRSPFKSNFFERYLKSEEPGDISLFKLSRKLFLYYVKSAVHYLFYIFKICQHFVSGQRSGYFNNDEDFVLIDVVFLSERIREAGVFCENFFFPGLTGYLRKKGIKYAYLPYFYSSSFHRNPFELFKVFRIIRNSEDKIFTEFQLLSFSDIFRIGYFILMYPFHVLRYMKKLGDNVYGDRILRYELGDSIDEVVFYNYIRNLIGRRLARLPFRGMKVISWYENQPLNKNLYRGLRKARRDITIYGTQLFPYSLDYHFMTPDIGEYHYGISPDIIVVNGPRFMPKNACLPYKIGPSLRNARLFREDIIKVRGNDVVVLLHLIKEDTLHMLRLLNDPVLSDFKFLIKAHPGLPIPEFKNMTPPNSEIADRDLYTLLRSANVVIGSGSGSLVEALSMGVPVVCIKSNRTFRYNSGFFDEGRGIIWEEVSSATELRNQLYRMQHFNDNAEIEALASKYRENYFSYPTEDNIKAAFNF